MSTPSDETPDTIERDEKTGKPAVADRAAKAARPKPEHSLRYRLYHGETAFDFMGRRNRWFVVSAVIILAGILSLFVRGLNFGIEFEGGSVWEFEAHGATVESVRDVMRSEGLGEATIQTLHGADGVTRIKVQAKVEGNDRDRVAKEKEITQKLADTGKDTLNSVNVTSVGPSWGGQISEKAYRALVIFLLLVSVYIWFRFEPKMAMAALAALFHDILVTVGVYSLSGFSVTPGTVIAFLTILGYSLYDTIVVFDKVQENTKGLAASGRMTYSDTVNVSMNQVLMRSLNTSLVAIMPIASVLFIGAYVLGATALEDFGLALFIGLLTGAYSSIFIASPMLAVLKEREPRYAAIRQRLAAKGISGGALTPAAATATAGGGSTEVLRPSGDKSGAKSTIGTTPKPSPARPANQAPRPRKKGRKR